MTDPATSTDFAKAFSIVKELAENFQKHSTYYLSTAYQEPEARKDFIDKLFIALGWDVNHDFQRNPYQQEVKVERTQQQNKATRRADYAFSLAPDFRDVRFFVEAKAPHISIRNTDDYFQIIRYGWNGNAPICVLTDFEEFHIVDCRLKPDLATALERGLLRFHYTDFKNEEKFKQIFYLFSHESVKSNSLEQYADSLPKPRGKAVQKGLFTGGYISVDESFIGELEDWREVLAREFKARNQALDSEELTEATQRTLDRLVFIRFLEDKLIEPEYIVANLGDKGDVWKEFIATSKRMDSKYNGIVFKPHFTDRSDFVAPIEAVFGRICEQMAHTNSPYNFDYLPIHILGSIYERFLGKVVHATGKRVRVEDKPEVRKAGGVYYTPEYIVRFIVDETVGVLIKNKTPNEISSLKFADIACGSGSFLITIYASLLDYHRDWYNSNPEQAKKDGCVFGEGGWHLTIRQKQKILLQNIYGVDIDPQAVEVAQLSLYLKLMEDETAANAQEMQVLFHEKILPDLRTNIKCGNSIVGFDLQRDDLFESKLESDSKRIRPFDWKAAFPFLKNQGFDAVVGNPPWVDIKGMEPLLVEYYFKRYATVENRMNIYGVFMQVGLSLTRKGGKFGYITPNSFLTQSSYTKLRQHILSHYDFDTIVRLPDDVFADVKAETAISIVACEKSDGAAVRVGVYNSDQRVTKISLDEAAINTTISQELWEKGHGSVINLYTSGASNQLTKKIAQNKKPLIDYCEVCLGLTPYDKYRGHSESQIQNRVFHSTRRKNKSFKKLLAGEDIKRYYVKWGGQEWISYGKWLGAPREERFFTKPRILIRQIMSGNPPRIYAAETKEELYNTQIAFNLLVREGVKLSTSYIVAVLNSSLMNYYHRNTFLDQSKRLFQKILIENAKQFPIRSIDFSNKTEKSAHDSIVRLAERMIFVQGKLFTARTDSAREQLESESRSLDSEIDRLVYELYQLNENEMKRVESEEHRDSSQ